MVIDHTNRDRFAFLVAENSGGFASLRGRIQALMRDLGCQDWTLEVLEGGPGLEGRSASIIVNGITVGECGELDPHVSESFDLNVPMSGAQIDVQLLASVMQDPVHSSIVSAKQKAAATTLRQLQRQLFPLIIDHCSSSRFDLE